MDETPDHLGVHATHCCVRSSKYLDDDRPVATGKVLPKYPCEDCTCLQMNPDAAAQANEWWEGLSYSKKAQVYLSELRW